MTNDDSIISQNEWIEIVIVDNMYSAMCRYCFVILLIFVKWISKKRKILITYTGHQCFIIETFCRSCRAHKLLLKDYTVVFLPLFNFFLNRGEQKLPEWIKTDPMRVFYCFTLSATHYYYFCFRAISWGPHPVYEFWRIIGFWHSTNTHTHSSLRLNIKVK